MGIEFQGFDPNRPVRIYRRSLPHWRQEGATYFITCRLCDSLPEHAVEHLEVLRRALVRENAAEGRGTSVPLVAGRGCKRDACTTGGGCKRDACTTVNTADRQYFSEMKQYLDAGHGACWLRDRTVRSLVQKAFSHFDGERYQIGEAAVLPNHLHVLVRPLPGHELEDILHSWKSFTSKRINRLVGRSGAVWQHESYDRLVRDSLEFARTGRYIRNNLLTPQQKETGW